MSERAETEPSIFGCLVGAEPDVDRRRLPDEGFVPPRVRSDRPGTWDEWPILGWDEWVEFGEPDPAELERARRRFHAALDDPADVRALSVGLNNFAGERMRTVVLDWTALSDRPVARVLELAEALIRRGTRRNAVRIGIALLSSDTAGSRDHLLWTLGRHSEFTRVCIEALRRSRPGTDALIARLGMGATGIGHWECVCALRGTTDPVAQEWLRRDG